MLDAQQMVHHFKPLIPLREVNGGDIHHALELALRVITQEGEDGKNSRGSGIERQFVLEHGELLDELGQTLNEVRSEVMQLLRCLGVQRERRVGRRRLRERRGGGWARESFVSGS